MGNRTAITAGIVGGAAALAAIGIAVAVAVTGNAGGEIGAAPAPSASSTPSPGETESTSDPEPEPETAPEPHDTTAALLHLIEEEKLAHDVYVTLGEQWGSRIFENIAASETVHQTFVAPLLDARAIEDPRSSEVGVFTDPGLQALYDQLIAQGSQSLDAALAVGITIEQMDIADLGSAIEAEDEADVISVLERLLAGSENHLRSFERLA